MIDLPREPNPGEHLDAFWGARVVRALRALFPMPGPGIRTATGPSGTTISADPPAEPVRNKPMPFDCKLGVAGEGASAATHLFVYVPDAYAGLVSIAGASGPVEVPPAPADQNAISEDDWLDAGPISPGQKATLQILVTNSDWAAAKQAACVIQYAWWHVQVGNGTLSGHVAAGPMGPPVVLAELGASGLRQRWHGRYRADRTQADADVAAGSFWSASDPRTLSISGDQGAMLLLHGFRSPSTISNPYKRNGTAPSAPDDILVLVRVLSSDGKTAELRYVRLADLAASSAGEGTADDPEGYDALTDLTSTPCPVGHDRTTPLVIYWNPCDLEDAQGNVLQPAGWQQGQFWPVGGSAAQCKGASIGDSNGNDAIDLDGHGLSGGWSASSNFDVGGNLAVYGESAFGIATAADLTVFGTLTLGSGAGAIDVGAALSALLGRVTTVENSLSGLETLLSQI